MIILVNNILQGMWWAVQTLTSLGYGDFTPQTLLGKIVGSLCSVCGVLVMALPIPIVVDNFADYYSEQKKIEAKELKKEAAAKQAEVDLEGERLANKRLVTTLTSSPGPFTEPPLSPGQEHCKKSIQKSTNVHKKKIVSKNGDVSNRRRN